MGKDDIEEPLPNRATVEAMLARKKDEWLHFVRSFGRDDAGAKFVEGEIYTLLVLLRYSTTDIFNMLDTWPLELDNPEWKDWKCALCGQVIPYIDARFHLEHGHACNREVLK